MIYSSAAANKLRFLMRDRFGSAIGIKKEGDGSGLQHHVWGWLTQDSNMLHCGPQDEDFYPF